MGAKEGGHFLSGYHCKEILAKMMMDATPKGGGNNKGGTRTKKRAMMWFVASLL
jgi:hypothetical protein